MLGRKFFNRGSVIKESYTQVSFSVPTHIPNYKSRLTHFLQEEGFDLSKFVFSKFDKNFESTLYVSSKREAKTLSQTYEDIDLSPFKFSSKIIYSSDWMNAWKKNYKSFLIGKNFIIIPKWEKTKVNQKDKIPIYLDPEQTFGAGTHPTTKLLTGQIEDLKEKFCDVLDIGMGSGVLMIVASYMGASTVSGFDIDPKSVLTTKKNLNINKIKPKRIWCQNLGRVTLAKRYDMVVANLLTNILIENQDRLLKLVKKGGYLLVSGVSKKNKGFFVKNFRLDGLQNVNSRSQEDWTSFLYQRVD